VLLRQRRYPEAIGPMRKAIELDPDCAVPHYGLGSALVASGAVAEGIASWRRATVLDPRLPLDLERKARNMRSDARPEAVEAICALALELEPAAMWAHVWAVEAMLAQGRIGAARDELRRFAALRPDDPDAWQELAEGFLAGGRECREPAAAVRAAGRAVELSRRQAAAPLVVLAEALVASGDAAAPRVLDEALALEPIDELRARIAACRAELARSR
jgi:predicted Zn-dependent protease